MQSIRVYVVDDHPMIRCGVIAMLAGERDMHCVGEAASGADAVRAAPALAPDVLLLDLAMPGMDGIATLAALRPLLPEARFVVMAAVLDMADARRSLAAGAVGYVVKDATAQELSTAIRAARRGQRMVPPAIAEALLPGDRHGGIGGDLTPRERELLVLMARGLANQEISVALGIAMPTVKFHVTNILTKLQSDNRTEAVLVALRQKIVRLE